MSIQHYVAANAHPVRPDEALHYRHLVTYADHVAALAEAEQRVRMEQCSTCCTHAEQQYANEFNAGREQGEMSNDR